MSSGVRRSSVEPSNDLPIDCTKTMKVIHRSQNLLILQERPLILWIIGGICIAIALFVIGSSTQEQVNLFWKIVFAVIFIAGGMFMILTPFATYRFDREIGNLILKRQGLFGTKIIEHRLSEIQDVQVEESTDSDGSTYRVIIMLMSGNCLPLTYYYNCDRIDKQKTVSWIKSFLHINN